MGQAMVMFPSTLFVLDSSSLTQGLAMVRPFWKPIVRAS